MHKSTISREKRRNRNSNGIYQTRDAHEYCLLRHLNKPKAVKVTGESKVLIRMYIKQDLSPEQVSAILWKGHEKPYQKYVKMITCDNGKEFVEHKRIASGLHCKVYFAHPFSSWERGLNENTNGLIWQYFPKGCDIRKVSSTRVKMAMDRLNNRPRKLLNWYTPNELYLGIPFQYLKA